MPFLSGNLAFERFRVSDFSAKHFGDDQIEILSQHAAGKVQTSAEENVHVGFLGGAHLLDQEFDLCKNVIGNAAHFSVRIDTNQIPSAMKKAWLQIELAGLAKENESGRPTKTQRKEAKESVEELCRSEAATGKYRKMQALPILWDTQGGLLYLGGPLGTAAGHCLDLIERCFEIKLSHVGAGDIALQWRQDNSSQPGDLSATCFVSGQSMDSYTWQNDCSQTPDFLGNEFVMWLWWTLENETDTITLPDDSTATVMLNKTLTLECPRGESGKETIIADSPTQLPEALQAVQAGKLPRKAGMTLIRSDRQFDLVLQAETFGVSSAKIHLNEDEEFDDCDRIDAVRLLSDSLDQLFHAFCHLRCGQEWGKQQQAIIQWLQSTPAHPKQAAA